MPGMVGPMWTQSLQVLQMQGATQTCNMAENKQWAVMGIVANWRTHIPSTRRSHYSTVAEVGQTFFLFLFSKLTGNSEIYIKPLIFKYCDQFIFFRPCGTREDGCGLSLTFIIHLTLY